MRDRCRRSRRHGHDAIGTREVVERHAKNVAILATSEGEWRVAYDLPSTVPYGDTSFALSIQGRTRGISRNHLLAFGAEIGLPERAAVKVLDELIGRLGGMEDRLRDGAIPIPQKTTADLIAELGSGASRRRDSDTVRMRAT